MGHGHQHRLIDSCVWQGHGPRHGPRQQHRPGYHHDLRWQHRPASGCSLPPLCLQFGLSSQYTNHSTCFLSPLSTTYLLIVVALACFVIFFKELFPVSKIIILLNYYVPFCLFWFECKLLKDRKFICSVQYPHHFLDTDSICKY